MADTMTLEQVLLEARLVANNGCVSITRKNCAEWADAIDAAIKQREWGANNPLKGWIFDKLAEALREGKKAFMVTSAQWQWEEHFNRHKRASTKPPKEYVGWNNDPDNPEFLGAPGTIEEDHG